MGGRLRVQGLVKLFESPEGPVRAVDDVTFTIEPGTFYTLLGPSGCGKSTTLRCVAGLERSDAGTIALDDRVVANHQPKVFVPPTERELGMVFQSYAIWPHMTVFQNVAFPLRAARHRYRLGRREINERVEEALATVQLDGYASRMATKLSGGQQQRLALARSLVTRPRLLLLDEPLSNLDAGLREHMRTELRTMQRRSGVTTLYVTHDQSEAFSMSDRIAVMEAGRIVQEGAPREIYSRPATAFVATFVGRTNLLRIVGGRPAATPAGGQPVALRTRAGDILVAPDGFRELDATSSIVVRPEDVEVSTERPPPRASTVLPGRIRRPNFLGESVEFEVAVGDETLISRQHPRVDLQVGQEVFVELPVDRCVVVSGHAARVGSHVHADADGQGPADAEKPDETSLSELPMGS